MHFRIYGHKNVLGTHPTTLEFTKDKDLTVNGDCIIGVKADFEIDRKLFRFKKINVRITCDNNSDEVKADLNPDFEDAHEIVIRQSGFLSKRTLGIHADKASLDINRKIIEKLKCPDNFADVFIEGID